MRAAPILRAKLDLPLIRLQNATFYRGSYSEVGGHPLFPHTTLRFPVNEKDPSALAVIGASSAIRTDFLNALRGQLTCQPSHALSYPYLASDAIRQKDGRLQSPEHAIKYVGFDADRGNVNLRGSYLSQRYESKRETDDYIVRDYLLGKTALNADESLLCKPPLELFERVVVDLRLQTLLDTPVSHLSNGQSRRTRIAQALLLRPELLMLDSPFMGLDVYAVGQLSDVLKSYASTSSPSIIMSLRSDEHIPTWTTDFVLLNSERIIEHQGTQVSLHKHLERIMAKAKKANKQQTRVVQTRNRSREGQVDHDERYATTNAGSRLFDDAQNLARSLEVNGRKRREKDRQRLYRLEDLREQRHRLKTMHESQDGFQVIDGATLPTGDLMIEMKGVQVSYGTKTVLGQWKSTDAEQAPGLWWTVRRGERWGVFGPNGSGKTTLTALITSDHPQSYSLPIQFFGRSRLPDAGKPGISFFDLQSRIGFTSPELHAFFPKHISIRQALESAWAEAPLAKAVLTPERDDRVDALLLWFRAELCPDLGMTDLQRTEFYRPVKKDLRAFMGRRIETWVAARRQAHIDQRYTFTETQSWADDRTFGSLSFASQRVLLFLRAIIKRPDIVILDEPFSGMDPLTVLKCQSFLSHGDRRAVRVVRLTEKGLVDPFVKRSELDLFGLSKFDGLTADQALIFIGHRKEEVPGCVRSWLCLPEPGEGEPRFGTLDGPLSLNPNSWPRIWNLPLIDVKRRPLSERASKAPLKKGPGYVYKSKYWLQMQKMSEAESRTRVLAQRKWWAPNRLRFRVEWVCRAVNKLDRDLQTVKLPLTMRQQSFQGKSASEKMLAQAELLFHDNNVIVENVIDQIGSSARIRYHRNLLRLRSAKAPPRRRIQTSTRFKVARGEVGPHGY